MDKRGCIGAPDIVVEILSPGNNKKKLINKFEVYEEAGVKEYWIVSASKQYFFRYNLDGDGKFQPAKAFNNWRRSEYICDAWLFTQSRKGI